MSSSQLPATDDDPRTADVDASSWLLRVFPHASQTSIFFRALLISAAILGVEYLVEVVWLDLQYWQLQDSFVADPGVPLSGLGLVFSLMLLGQWGTRYVELWGRVRPAFDVPAKQYDVTVRRSLDGLYGRDHVPFVLFVVVQIGVYSLFGSDLPAGFLHVGFLHFFAVTALYSFYRHIVIIHRVSGLDLVDINRARPTLSEVAEFSIIVCLNWFGALSAGVVYFWVFTEQERSVVLFYDLSILFFVAAGFLLFVIPLVLLHEALVRVKRKQLHAINEDYEELYEAWREGDLEDDPSVGLDMLQTRREIVETSSTWPYRLVSVAELAFGAVVPTALSVVRTFVR